MRPDLSPGAAVRLSLPLLLLSLCVALAGATGQAQRVRYVAPNGDDRSGLNNCLDENAPCAGIAQALSQAGPTDVIDLAAGVYTESDLTIVFSVNLRGKGPAESIIDGGRRNTVFRIAPGVVTCFEGLTIRNGDGLQGGALFLDEWAVAELSGVELTGNRAALGGAAFVSPRATLRLDNGRIDGNVAQGGGGVYSETGLVHLRESVVRQNRAAQGGGVYQAMGATLNLDGVALVNNTADLVGGGILNDGGLVNMLNVTMTGNTAAVSGGGLFNDGGEVRGSHATLVGNTAQNGGSLGNLGYGVMQNSIFARSRGRHCLGALSGRNNLLDDASCGLPVLSPTGLASAPSAGSDGRVAFLLADNSNAVDAVPTGDCTSLSSGVNPLFSAGAAVNRDGRGVPRPIGNDQDGAPLCDIGAVEFRPRLIVRLAADPAPSGVFTFSGDLGAFTLSNPQTPQRLFDPPSAGMYTVRQNLLPDWKLEQLICTGDYDRGSVLDRAQAMAVIDLDADETIACTFVNAMLPQTGSITILHTARPPVDTTFEYTGALGNFALHDPGRSQRFFNRLPVGTYSVRQPARAGWALKAIACEGDADAGSTVDLNRGVVAIDLDQEEDVICSFYNEQQVAAGNVAIVLESRPADNRPLAFRGDLGRFTLKAPSAGSISFRDVEAGQLTVVAAPQASWTVERILCQGDHDGGSVAKPAEGKLIIDLDGGETIICRFEVGRRETKPPPAPTPQPGGSLFVPLVLRGRR